MNVVANSSLTVTFLLGFNDAYRTLVSGGYGCCVCTYRSR